MQLFLTLILSAWRLWQLTPDVEPVTPVAATVVWVEGEVTQAASGAAEEELAATVEAMARLRVGEEVSLAEDAQVWALVGPRTLATLSGPGGFRITVDGLRPLRGAMPPRRVQLAGYEEGPVQATTGPAPEAPTSAGGLRLVSPRDTAVTTPRVRLIWAWPDGGARFDLMLERRDPDGGTEVVEQWQGLAGLVGAPWEPLTPGAWYRWTVAVSDGADRGEQTRQSWFMVLTPEEAGQARHRAAAIDALTSEVIPHEPVLDVLRARVLETHGLMTEAEMLWADLAERHPDRAGPARQVERLRARQLRPPTPRPSLPLPFLDLL